MKRLGKKGFSLIEVMVAMMMVAGIGMAVMEMIQWQTKSSRSVASVMGRNELQDRLRAMVSNSFSCPYVFGAGQTGGPVNYSGLKSSPVNGVTSLPTLWDSQKRVFLTPNLELRGSNIKILSMSLITQNAPVASGTAALPTHKISQMLTVTLQKMTGNPNQAAVGGNGLSPIQIPLVMTIVDSSDTVSGCSFDSGNGMSADDCSQAGYGLVMGSNGTAGCKKLLCEANTFPVGTDVTGFNAGQIHCCPTGNHFAGTLEGNPVCCPKGNYYSVNDNQCKPIASLCFSNSGWSYDNTHYYGSNETLQSSNETVANCCHTQDGMGGGGGEDLNCIGARSVYTAVNYSGNCPDGGGTLHAIDPRTSENPHRVTGVHVNCNSNQDTWAHLTCCANVDIPLANTNAQIDCAANNSSTMWSATAPGANGSTGACVFNSASCVFPTEFVNSAGNGCKGQDTCTGSDVPDGSGGCTGSGGGGSDPCPGQTTCNNSFGTFDHCADLMIGC